MPSEPLVAAGTKSLLNIFLYYSPAPKTARLRLLDKVLCVEVKDFSASLILAFSERQADVLGEWAGDANYTVVAYASVLPKLRDHQQLTALIHSGELEAQGDIQVMQNFIALADLAEFDPAELLAPHTGDIAAEGISKAMRGGARFLHHGIERQQRYATEVTTEEWRMAPGSPEVAWLAEEAVVVGRAVDALAKRLEELEAKWRQVKYGAYISSFAPF